MNKKGMTVVELIVSFTLTMAIVVFLVQIITNLTRMYNNNDRKTQLLNKQALISDAINESLINKKLNEIVKCGENCYTFNYSNGENSLLKLENNILTFDELSLPLTDATYKSISLDMTVNPVQTTANNGILIINIPIESDINFNFDVKVIYRFRTDTSNIDEYFLNN